MPGSPTLCRFVQFMLRPLMKWKDTNKYLELLKDVLAATTRKEAMRRKNDPVVQLEENHADVAEWNG